MQQGSNKPQSDRFETTVARTLGEVEAIRPIWEEMQRNQSHPIPNADINRYLCVVAARENAHPYIILLRRNGKPETIAIGRIEEMRLKYRIGYITLMKPKLKCLSIVYGGILGNLTDNVCTALLRELTDTLARGEANVVFLSHLRTDSNLYQLHKKKTSVLCRNHIPLVEKHWETHIPESFEAYCTTLSKNRRKERKKLNKRLKETTGGEVEVKYWRKQEQLDEFIQVCSRIRNLTYKKALNVGFTGGALATALIKHEARNNRWRGYVLYVGDKPIAFEFGIVYGARFFAEAKGYDPDWESFGPGTILQYKIFENLCNDPGVNAYDYGYGDAVFKQRFGTEFWHEASVYIFACRIYPVFINIVLSCLSAVNEAIKYIISKVGATLWLKRSWRTLLTKHSKTLYRKK